MRICSMNEEFAIEPSAFNNSMEMRYVMEKFGFDKGKFIVSIPSKWTKKVYEHIQSFPEVEQAKAKRILHKYKNSLVNTDGFSYDPSNAWVGNIQRASLSLPIKGIIAAEQNSHSYPTIEEIDDDFFGISNDIRIESGVDNYAAIARRLLEASNEIVIVDPYFNLSKPTCEIVLKRFLSIAQNSSKQKFFVIWARDAESGMKGYKKMLQNKYKESLLPKSTLTVNLVDDAYSIQKMHARLLFSLLGGLRFDYGFEAFPDRRIVDISLVTSHSLDSYLDWYTGTASKNDFNILEQHVIVG
jgi:hypothetical protein